MRKIVVVIIVAVLSLLLVYVSMTRKPKPLETVKVSSCLEISSPGVYVLSASLTSENACIKVSSDNVIVEGNGFSIENGEYGVYIEGVKNVTISNLKVVNCGYGIYVKDSEEVKLVNLEVRNCKKPGVTLVSVKKATLRNIYSSGNAAGIVVVGSEEDLEDYLRAEAFMVRDEKSLGVIVSDSTLTDNEIDGFFLLNGVDIVLRNCTCIGNSGGIYLFYSENVVVENCTALDNYYVGVMLDNCDYCEVRRSIVKGNTGGIRLDYSDYCVVEENLAVDNILDGIFLQRTSGHNVVSRNVIRGGTYGIRIINAEKNRIEKNSVHDALRCDLCIERGLDNIIINNEFEHMEEISGEIGEKKGKD